MAEASGSRTDPKSKIAISLALLARLWEQEAILQAKEKERQTYQGVVYTDGKMLPPSGEPGMVG